MKLSHALILSAGKGSRLLPLTADRPKCLIEISGKTLLEWQIQALAAAGIADVTVVTGFKPEMVEMVLRGLHRSGGRLQTLFNPFYHVADNLGSVWMAREAFTRDTLLLNGDTLVSPAIVRRLLSLAHAPISVTIDEKVAYDDDDMKVLRDGDRLVRIGKKLPPGGYDAESIGLLSLRGEGRARFVAAVDAAMRTPDGTTSFYLSVIDQLADESIVGTVSIGGQPWAEVDFPADLENARTLTASWIANGAVHGWPAAP